MQGCRFTSVMKYDEVWDLPVSLAICDKSLGAFVSCTEHEGCMLILRCLFLVHGDTSVRWGNIIADSSLDMFEMLGTVLRESRIWWIVRPRCITLHDGMREEPVTIQYGWGVDYNYVCGWYSITCWLILLTCMTGRSAVSTSDASTSTGTQTRMSLGAWRPSIWRWPQHGIYWIACQGDSSQSLTLSVCGAESQV